MNLYEFIKSNDFRGFSLRLIRRMTKQMLSSLVLLKGKRVIHCDLKPENILLAHPMRSEIKVIDFGSSCFEHEKGTFIICRYFFIDTNEYFSVHIHPVSFLSFT
jgi:dual specificity tyrosine-phosphorylation-regulated kinase 2/3/4